MTERPQIEIDGSLPPLLPRVPHGGPASQHFSGLDFSVNSNPYGPNPLLLDAVRQADQAHYPDPSYLQTRQRLADWHGLEAAQVALSVGASDLLHRLARAYLGAGDVLLSLHAPFGEMERATQLQRAEVEVVSRLPDTLPPQTRLVYVGQPHNPTGHCLTQAELEEVSGRCAAAGALLILDLAYVPFGAAATIQHPNVVALHSPGKAHGLVGARPAYAVAAPDVIARLDNLAPAWHVPASTEALLRALPGAQGFLQATLPQVAEDARRLAAELARLGHVVHHQTPYLLLEVGDARAVTAGLLARGLRVRDCTSYGLAHCIRVSTQGKEADGQLVAALQTTLGRGLLK